MTFSPVVKMSLNVTTNSPSLDYTHLHDHTLPTYDMTIHVQTIYINYVQYLWNITDSKV